MNVCTRTIHFILDTGTILYRYAVPKLFRNRFQLWLFWYFSDNIIGNDLFLKGKKVLRKCIDIGSNLIPALRYEPAGMYQIMNGLVAKKKYFFPPLKCQILKNTYVVMIIKNDNYVKKAHMQIKMLKWH